MIIRIFFLIFLSISFFVFFPTVGWSDDEEKTYQGVSYACAGVGDSKDDPKWKAYPLKLMFTAGGRAYVSEVDVSIQDSSGAVVLKVNCDAPWLVAKLKPGSYSVSAKADGATTKRARVNVPATGQNELAIRFSEIPAGTGNE